MPMFDQEKSDAFADRMVDMLNESSLSLMVCIGHKTGLFDTLDRLSPATSDQIAFEAGLKERYVREWLGAVVVGNIVAYDPQSGHYWLPPEHAAWLTRSAGSDNLASTLQFIPVMAGVIEEVVSCFQNGGGVPYEAFPDFHHTNADSSRSLQDERLVEVELRLAPGLVERLQAGIRVADIGCGQGHVLNLMAEAFPRSRFTGYDFVPANITAATEEAARMSLDNVDFQVKDIALLDATGEFDLITGFDVIHDQAHPDVVLKRVATALKPDGLFFMVDIQASSHLHENHEHVLGPFLYTVSCMHCMTVSLAMNGAGLGTMWGEQKALEMLAEAGFARVEVKQIEGDSVNNYYLAKLR